MIDAHGGPLVDGQCAVTWGVMAPADGGPGVLHICREQAARPVPPIYRADHGHDQHDGPHRCSCGEGVERNPTTVVVCHHPAGVIAKGTLVVDGQPVCGVTVTGTELVDYRGPRRLGHDQMRAQTILSIPCGHPTQRQAS